MDQRTNKSSEETLKEIQTLIFRILEKIGTGEKTHNNHPDTIKFMEAAATVSSFEDYFQELKTLNTPAKTEQSKKS